MDLELPEDPSIEIQKVKGSITYLLVHIGNHTEGICIELGQEAQEVALVETQDLSSLDLPVLLYSKTLKVFLSSQNAKVKIIWSGIESIVLKLEGLDYCTSYSVRVKTFNSLATSEEAEISFKTLNNRIGSVYTWGNNENGNLGLEEPGVYYSPIPHFGLPGNSIVSVSASENSNLALTHRGEIYSWGTVFTEHQEMVVAAPFAINTPVVFREIACGLNFFGAISLEGNIFTCGCGFAGQLGQGSQTFCSDPTVITNFSDDKIQRKFLDISCSYNSFLACTEEGDLYHWGMVYTPVSPEQVQVSVPQYLNVGANSVKQVACGSEYFCVVTKQGKLLSWGNNSYGQLGLGQPILFLVPTEVELSGVKQVSCGNGHTVCLNLSGDVYAWGKSKLGQTGQYVNSRTPVLLEGIEAESVSAGGNCTLLVAKEGNLLSFGEGRNGCLGIGVGGKSAKPRKVNCIQRVLVTEVSEMHCLAIVS